MLGAIPNPKKSFDVDFSSQKIIDTIPYIPLVNNKYKFTSKNDVLKTYRFEALEFLSLGIYVDISISTISDSRSKIEIEVSRKIGAFDQSFEVAKANDHISRIATLISECVSLSPSQINDLELKKNSKPEEKPTQSKSTMILVALFLGNLGIHRLMMGYSNWWLMLITFGGCGLWSLIDLIKLITGNMKMANGDELI
jgi:hypothetical protein